MAWCSVKEKNRDNFIFTLRMCLRRIRDQKTQTLNDCGCKCLFVYPVSWGCQFVDTVSYVWGWLGLRSAVPTFLDVINHVTWSWVSLPQGVISQETFHRCPVTSKTPSNGQLTSFLHSFTPFESYRDRCPCDNKFCIEWSVELCHVGWG